MEHLLEAYASSSEEEELKQDPALSSSVLGELPLELTSMFADSGENSISRLQIQIFFKRERACDTDDLLDCWTTVRYRTSTLVVSHILYMYRVAAWSMPLCRRTQAAAAVRPLVPQKAYILPILAIYSYAVVFLEVD